MKIRWILLLSVLVFIEYVQAQQNHLYSIKHPKKSFFIFWGYNRSVYGKSDIHLKGEYYDFTLYDVPAKDLPEDFTFENYLNPVYVTVPQFNARVGFFITDKYAISGGWDHTKYQIHNDVEVGISGYISSEISKEYAGTYNNDRIRTNHNSFVKIEHSDGLNLIQLNLERHDNLLANPEESMGLSWVNGAGIIFPMPWTNATIFGSRNDDRPHFTGVGVSLFTGFKFHFLSNLYLQALGQAGYLHMPGIVITPKGGSERASQNIRYFQGMMVLGYNFRIF